MFSTPFLNIGCHEHTRCKKVFYESYDLNNAPFINCIPFLTQPMPESQKVEPHHHPPLLEVLNQNKNCDTILHYWEISGSIMRSMSTCKKCDICIESDHLNIKYYYDTICLHFISGECAWRQMGLGRLPKRQFIYNQNTSEPLFKKFKEKEVTLVDVSKCESFEQAWNLFCESVEFVDETSEVKCKVLISTMFP